MVFYPNIKIISGGQTGADRAALDFALRNGIPCGGWCPKGRRAEDGLISLKYPLQETSSIAYPERTQKNIESSDGTVIFYNKKFDAGTGLTLNLCKKLGKPFLIVKLSNSSIKEEFRDWLNNYSIQVLNVAGPRESSEKGIYSKVTSFLENC